MAPQDQSTDSSSKPIPFGAMDLPSERGTTTGGSSEGGDKKDWRKTENKRGSARRGGRRRRKPSDSDASPESGGEGRPEAAGPTTEEAPRSEPRQGGNAESSGATGEAGTGRKRRRRRRGSRSGGGGGGGDENNGRSEAGRSRSRGRRGQSQGQGGEGPPPRAAEEVTGMVMLDKGGFGSLRQLENQYVGAKDDVYIPRNIVSKYKLREGSVIEGKAGRGQGKHKQQLAEVTTVDGKDPKDLMKLVSFKSLVSIDPDFHYSVGDETDDVSMRIVDIICPVGRGTRGLIVAPPRSGKTILMRKFAKGIEEIYPDVHLMVLLVDERPEEATEWRRSTERGQVFVSTNDESAKHHVQLAEAVWKRAARLVELGEEVILLLDSITRLARAYNNATGGSGRTMSGGIDSRTMERPRAFFGAARNTETAGSLTILGTTLIETGSKMDQVIFEEFKGTGNMELVLSRKLADRRIFPAIDIERSGTRKEEKLISPRRLRQINTLRRVLLKLNFIEAMELLVNKLEDVEKTDDFLQRFEVDPEA